jgi:hypothetical protein
MSKTRHGELDATPDSVERLHHERARFALAQHLPSRTRGHLSHGRKGQITARPVDLDEGAVRRELVYHSLDFGPQLVRSYERYETERLVERLRRHFAAAAPASPFASRLFRLDRLFHGHRDSPLQFTFAGTPPSPLRH